MPDTEQAQVNRVGRLGLEESQRLLALGFDPIAPVYASYTGFDVDRIADALFQSEFSRPALVPFEWHDGLKGSAPVILPMEVEIVQRVLVTAISNVGENSGKRFDCLEPEWYLRGLLAQSQLNPNGEVVRMHAYIHVLEPEPPDNPEGADNSASIQVLHELPSRTPRFSFDGRVIEGEGYPTLT